MLTLILLVVLGGGVGLLTVWLIDARGLARLLGRFAPASLRRTRDGDTTPLGPAPIPAVEPALAGAGTAPVRFEPVEPTFEPESAPPPVGRRSSDRVPKAYTALEGSYREVAKAPLWRKLVSLVLLAVILVVIGVAIAAIAGATFGIVAELVDSAVG